MALVMLHLYDAADGTVRLKFDPVPPLPADANAPLTPAQRLGRAALNYAEGCLNATSHPRRRRDA